MKNDHPKYVAIGVTGLHKKGDIDIYRHRDSSNLPASGIGLDY